ncbi:cytochrome P450 [Dactylosporangium sp. AC04546]|uniref:cytochrome P450 n=1 Tax=Dactylosporangium sp. AC04546 TaxID=2862460 RepID=UPI001EDE8D72|nr:cytochrome P450 [Dactylosporangium sp. AC04546]WVK86145.1 cytochrome P450 [Dactylosporangium sp. AC04546]
MTSINDSARKIDRGDTAAGCPVELGDDGVWHVTGHAAGRAVLRSTGTVQAGLGVETVEKLPARIRRPVLYRDGPEHREHRRQTARFFTPRRVDEHYRDVMVRITEEQLGDLRRAGTADLSTLSFRLAVEVASAVVGLTESRPGLDRRLERFFPEKFGKPGFTSIEGLRWFFNQNRQFLEIYLKDVRPAVKARRRQRRDDLISHLIDEGCRDGEILGEVITFAAAGMITTREFINLAAWHLFTDDLLRQRYREAAEPERFAILHELLRLEPVVGNLKRRTTAELELPAGDTTVTVPAGALVDVAVSTANLDPVAVGDRPAEVCPARPVDSGVAPAGLSFGDGPHRCPGAHVAIQESDIFLTRLLDLPGVRMVQAPRVAIKPDISGYELRGLTVAAGTGTAAG